ncbi:MAG: hypothetical protein J0M11_15455 [Anaerolineae bacterium]|jgi:hypothetical protein|nr:hypothetical protein [Anaerolineae bacterium]
MELVINTIGYLSRGVPGVFVAGACVLLMILSLVRKEPSYMVFAAFLAIPATYVFGSWAGILLVVRLFPLFLLAAAFFISKDEMVFGWIFPMPVLFFLGYYLVTLVASNFAGV